MLKLTVECCTGRGGYSLIFSTVEAASKHIEDMTRATNASGNLFHDELPAKKQECARIIFRDSVESRYLLTLERRR